MSRKAVTQVLSQFGRCLTFGSDAHFACRASSSLASKDGKALHPDLINPAIKRTQYAVRGELYLRAMELQKEGMKITFTNGAAVFSRERADSRTHC